MAGSEKNDAFVAIAPGLQPRITGRGGRPGIDITGVRHDQGLGRGATIFLHRIEKRRHGVGEFSGRARIETARDGGLVDCVHACSPSI